MKARLLRGADVLLYRRAKHLTLKGITLRAASDSEREDRRGA